jgi:hypothetical protein
MEYATAIEHTSGYKVLPPDAATETVAPTSDPSQQHNESEFENGDSLVEAPPISRSPEPDSGSESTTRACVNETAPPTTITDAATVCNTISPNYCPVDFHNNNGFSNKLQDPSIEDVTEEEGEVEGSKATEGPYRSNTNRDQAHHDDNRLLELGGGVANITKRHMNHHQNILRGEEGERVTTEKRRCIRLREGDVLHISESDQRQPGAGSSHHQQQGVPEAESHLSYLDLRVTQQEQGLQTTSDSRLQDVTDTALYGAQGVKRTAGSSDRYRLQQLTAGPNNNDMPYSSSLPSTSLEVLRMRHQQNLVENSAEEQVNADGIVLAAQSPHAYQLHGQGMRIRSDAFQFGVLFPHVATSKTIPEQHFSTSTQGLSFGIQENHQDRGHEDIDKSRSHHQHNQVNGIDDVIQATLKSEDEINSSDETRSERNHHHSHHQYLLSRTGASPQQSQEEYLQHHQDSSSPELRRNGRSASPSDHHLQHHRDVILSGRTQIHNSDGGGSGGERTPLLSNSNLSSGAGSAGNNNSFTHLTSLQPSSSSTPSPLGLGGNTTAEDGGGGGSVLQQLSPAGDDDTNGHRGMYASTSTSALSHHHQHHLSGLHHSAVYHHHDAAAVNSPSTLMHSTATNLSR